jgi:membrane protease YdiL (CAAX protease family)
MAWSSAAFVVPIAFDQIALGQAEIEGSPTVPLLAGEIDLSSEPASSDGSALPIALAGAAILVLAVAISRQWWRLRDEAGPPALLRGGLSLIVFAAMVLAGGIGAGLTMHGHEGSLAWSASTMAGLVAGQLLAAAPFLWLVRRDSIEGDRSPTGGAIRRTGRSATSPLRAFGFGLLAMALAYPVIATLGQVVSLIEGLIRGAAPDPVAHDTLRALVEGGGLATFSGLVVAVLVVTAIPCCEEIAYRGLLQPAMAAGIGRLPLSGRGSPDAVQRVRWIAMGVTSAAFSLMHLAALPDDSRVSSLLMLMSVSMLLGWCYERTGRLWAPIAAHGFFNAINLSIVLAAV